MLVTKNNVLIDSINQIFSKVVISLDKYHSQDGNTYFLVGYNKLVSGTVEPWFQAEFISPTIEFEAVEIPVIYNPLMVSDGTSLGNFRSIENKLILNMGLIGGYKLAISVDDLEPYIA